MAKIIKNSKGHATSKTKINPKKKPTLRNVLAQPFPTYWPQINTDESDRLLAILKCIEQLNPNIFKKSVDNPVSDKETTKNLSAKFGLSETLRAIQNGAIEIFIITADLRPKYLIHQIISLALSRNANINIMIVSGLANNLQDNNLLNFQCCCLGFQNISTLSEQVQDFFVEISGKYKVPDIILNQLRGNCLNKKRDEGIVEIKNFEKKVEPNIKEKFFDELYIRRNQSGQRSFIPAGTKYAGRPKAFISNSFISLSDVDRNEMGGTENMATKKSDSDINYKFQNIRSITGNALSGSEKKEIELNQLKSDNIQEPSLSLIPTPKLLTLEMLKLESNNSKVKSTTNKSKKKKLKKNKNKMVTKGLPQPDTGKILYNYIRPTINRIQPNPNKSRKRIKPRKKNANLK